MGLEAPTQDQAQAQEFTVMKEMDVDVEGVPEPCRGDAVLAPATPVPKKKCCKKILAALCIGAVTLLVVFGMCNAIGGDGDDDMDDMDTRNELCLRWARRNGMKGPKHGVMAKGGDDDDDKDKKADDQDDINEDNEDAKKYCRAGGKECGSMLMLKDKESGEESDLTVYAEEGGVKEIMETLSSKYTVMDPLPLPCAVRGKVGDDNDDNDDKDGKKGH